MQAVTEQPIKKYFFEFSRVFPGYQPLAKQPEDSGYEIEWGAQCKLRKLLFIAVKFEKFCLISENLIFSLRKASCQRKVSCVLVFFYNEK